MTKPIKPNRESIAREDWLYSEIDRDKALDAVQAAKRALLSEDRAAGRREIVLFLLEEAAQTEKTISKPGPRGDVSCMPEVYHTANEIFMTEVAMAADGIMHAPEIRIPVSAAAASRYMEVVKWLRFAKGRNRKQSKELLWLFARGVPAGAVARILGYRNANAALAARWRRLNEIVERLEKERIFS